MSTADIDGEREVDLARWRGAVAARWWLPVAGLIAGALVGYVLSFSGGTVYKATALLSLGQPFSPNGGAPVASYATNPRAVAEIVRSESAIKRAAAKAGIGPGALRRNISTGTVGATTGPGAARAGAPLVNVTVQLHRPKRAEDAANELAKIVILDTTSKYVGTKIKALTTSLAAIQDQLNSIAPKITLLEREVDDRSLGQLDRLLLATQLDNAQQRRGQLLDLQTQEQQQLALARNVESAQVIRPAAAVKSTARSRRTSILVGALLGLILGAIAAIVADVRAPRERSV